MIRVALNGILVDIFFRITVLIFMINYVFFLFFHSQFQENTILFLKSFLSKALKAIISSKPDE